MFKKKKKKKNPSSEKKYKMKSIQIWIFWNKIK
jgi:hypothetical protein